MGRRELINLRKTVKSNKAVCKVSYDEIKYQEMDWKSAVESKFHLPAISYLIHSEF